jgi:hypothetical protein
MARKTLGESNFFNKSQQRTAQRQHAVMIEQVKQTFDLGLLLRWVVYLYWFGVLHLVLTFNSSLCIAVSSATIICNSGREIIVKLLEIMHLVHRLNNIFINPESTSGKRTIRFCFMKFILSKKNILFDLLLRRSSYYFQWFNPLRGNGEKH